MSHGFDSRQSAKRAARATREVEQSRFATSHNGESNETIVLQVLPADGGVGLPAKQYYWNKASNTFALASDVIIRVVPSTLGLAVGYTSDGVPVYASGGSACPPSYVMIAQITGLACDGFGSNLVSEQTYSLYATGCVESGKFAYVAVSGVVRDGEDAPVEDVDILGSDVNPNEGAPNSVVIATTNADGEYSGFTRIVMDITSPTPSWYVAVAASGYSPSPAKVYNDAGPVTVDFAP